MSEESNRLEIVGEGLIRLGGREVLLTAEQAALINTLVRREGFVPVEDLCREVCGLRSRGSGDRIRQLVRRTRMRLGEHAWRLASRKGVGYRWIGEREHRPVLLIYQAHCSLVLGLNTTANIIEMDVNAPWHASIARIARPWAACVVDLPRSKCVGVVRRLRGDLPDPPILALCDAEDLRTQRALVRLGANHLARPADASVVAAFVRDAAQERNALNAARERGSRA